MYFNNRNLKIIHWKDCLKRQAWCSRLSLGVFLVHFFPKVFLQVKQNETCLKIFLN